MLSYQTLIVEKTGPVLKVTINRPDQLNALNDTCIRDLSHLFAELKTNLDIRVVTLEGAGTKAFVAGADIKGMSDMTADLAYQFARRGQVLSESMGSAPQIIVGKIRGFALGGGCELAMACDILIASKASKFGQPEVNLGIIPGFGGTQRLVRRVGLPVAMDMLLSGKGKMLTADEAWQLGLVSRVVDDAQLDTVTQQCVDAILLAGPEAVRATKQLAMNAGDMTLSAGLHAEAHAFSRCFARSEAREGMQAFMEKRTPKFEG